MFLLSFIGGNWSFVCGVIRPVQSIVADRFFISLMVAELLLLNQENSYVMFNWWQLVNHEIYQKSVYMFEFYRFENYVEKFSAFSALR